jgi:hypothetical protein
MNFLPPEAALAVLGLDRDNLPPEIEQQRRRIEELTLAAEMDTEQNGGAVDMRNVQHIVGEKLRLDSIVNQWALQQIGH